MTYLWEVLLEGNYIRTVKNLAEEGVELLGYSLMTN
ncbi:mannonate dehydratase [Aliivibrio salmonicida]|nr:mannonate dehydratase [Aliivibrio salmonicida]